MTRRAIKTHPRCQLVYLYQTIPKVWLWKMVVGHILSWADFYVIYVIDTVRVFFPKCPLTTVRNRFSADELQISRVEADDAFVVRPR